LDVTVDLDSSYCLSKLFTVEGRECCFHRACPLSSLVLSVLQSRLLRSSFRVNCKAKPNFCQFRLFRMGMARSPSLAGMKTIHTTDTRHLQKHLLLAVCDSLSNRCSVEPASRSKEVTLDHLHTEFSFCSTLHNETSLII
jgi:hypothetical protein